MFLLKVRFLTLSLFLSLKRSCPTGHQKWPKNISYGFLKTLLLCLLISPVAQAGYANAQSIDLVRPGSGFTLNISYEVDTHTGKITRKPYGLFSLHEYTVEGLSIDVEIDEPLLGIVTIFLQSSQYNFRTKLATLQLSRDIGSERIDRYYYNGWSYPFKAIPVINTHHNCNVNIMSYPNSSVSLLVPKMGCGSDSPILISETYDPSGQYKSHTSKPINYKITAETEITAGYSFFVFRESSQPQSSLIILSPGGMDQYGKLLPQSTFHIDDGPLILDFIKVLDLEKKYDSSGNYKFKNVRNDKLGSFHFLTVDGAVISFTDKSAIFGKHPSGEHSKYISRLSVTSQSHLKNSKVFPMTNLSIRGPWYSFYVSETAHSSVSYALFNETAENFQLDFGIDIQALQNCITQAAQTCSFIKSEKMRSRKDNFLKSILGIEDLFTDNPKLFSTQVSVTSAFYSDKVPGKKIIVTFPYSSQPEIKVYTLDEKTNDVELTQVLTDCATTSLANERARLLKKYPNNFAPPQVIIKSDLENYKAPCDQFSGCSNIEYFKGPYYQSTGGHATITLDHKLEIDTNAKVKVKTCEFKSTDLY